MTKQDIIKNMVPYSKWFPKHTRYVKSCVKELRKYFDVDRFSADVKSLACPMVIENILAMAYAEENYSTGEFEDYLSHMFNMSIDKLLEYRTDQYWLEMAEI